MKFFFLFIVIFVAGALADVTWAAPATKPAVTAPPAEKEVAKPATTETAADMAGLRILSVGPKSLLDQLGIKKNDVLVSLNGQSITSINDIEKFFQERKSKTVNLELLRNGRPETFTYDLK